MQSAATSISQAHSPLGPPAPYVRVQLHRGAGPLAAAIRWQTRGPFAHAALRLGEHVWEAREGRGVIWGNWLGAAPKHVSEFGLRDFAGAHVGCERTRMLRAWLNEQLGKPYDYSSVMRFVSRRQASRQSAGIWFCSELVFAALGHIGIKLFRATEPWEVSPNLLARSPLLHRIA